MAITINTGDLKTILETTPSTQNILLVGKHGIAKSSPVTLRNKAYPLSPSSWDR